MFDPQSAVLIEGGDALLGGQKFGLPLSVVVRTKSTMARFAAPSFHEGSECWAWVVARLASAIAKTATVLWMVFIVGSSM